MLLLIDNYDSFTYNLYQYLAELGAESHVVRNDATDAGRDRGDGAGAHRHLAGAAHAARGGHLRRRRQALRPASSDPRRLPGAPVHRPGLRREGRRRGGDRPRQAVAIHHDGRASSAACPIPFPPSATTRWRCVATAFPPCLEISAWTESGLIMGLRHRELPVEGVQFHPESIMTAAGKSLLRNFLELARGDERV